MIRGAYSRKGEPTKIVMTDFTYSSQMNCRFVFKNPSQTSRYITWKVKAYGGVKSSNNLYGDKFLSLIHI